MTLGLAVGADVRACPVDEETGDAGADNTQHRNDRVVAVGGVDGRIVVGYPVRKIKRQEGVEEGVGEADQAVLTLF